MKKVLALFLLLAIAVHADTAGNITFPFYNATVGLFGYTVEQCNLTDDCYGYTCFLDYVNVTGSAGSCNITASTSCYHNGYFFASGATVCVSNVTYRICSSGGWSVPATCGSGQTCTTSDIYTGSCSTASSSSSTGSGSNPNNLTSTIHPAMVIVAPANFEIVQGTSQDKTVTVRNTGNMTLNNVSLSLSVTWGSVQPAKVDKILRNNNYAFVINFSPATDLAAVPYQVNVYAKSVELNSTASFLVTVRLGEQSVQEQVIPNINLYTDELAALYQNITALEARGVNVSRQRAVYLSAQEKLSLARQMIEAKNFTAAAELVDQAKTLIDQDSVSLVELDEQTKFKLDPMWIVYGVVVLAVIAVVRYLMLPPKPNEKKKTLYELLEEHENSFAEKIRRRFNAKNKPK